MHDIADDPNWPRASAWIAGEHLPDPVGSIGIIGAPLECSLSGGRADKAPDAIRTALSRLSTYDVDTELDVRLLAAHDHGNLDIAQARPEDAFDGIRHGVEEALQRVDAVVLLGGDNGITRGGCHGLGEPIVNVGLLTLDAHFDLRDTDEGFHNGNPVRTLLEDGLPGENIVQIGIQSFSNSRSHAEVARQAGIAVVSAERVHRRGLSAVVTEALADLGQRVNAIYVDIDLDVLDRAYSPATPGSRPGGLHPWQLRSAAQLFGLNPKVCAIDLVEIDPTRDVADVTVFAAAECLLAFASGVLARKVTVG